MLKSFVLSLVAISASGVCGATTLTVSASGTYSSTDVKDAYVTPGDNFSVSFAIDSAPVLTPSDYTPSSFKVPVSQFSYSEGGAPVSIGDPSSIAFYTGSFGGGFGLIFQDAELIFSGTQLFTGSTAAPTFSPGTPGAQTWIFFDATNDDSGSGSVVLTASGSNFSPEPSSAVLCICSGVFLFAAFGLCRVARRTDVAPEC